MTLRQTIQAAPGKAAELIAKLSATSNQAVKTRESLFAELSDEFVRYVEVEEQHLLPLLRKHPDTKELAADALKGNKDLRATLERLSAAPKDDDGFLVELAELNKGFQQHVRNERKELLPAVLIAIGDEEATTMAANIEAAAADAEQAKRDEKREERAQAKRQAEAAEQAAAAERAAAAEAEKAKREELAQARRQAEEAEQAAAVERAAVAEAEKAKRAEKRRERAQAKRQAEEAEQAAAAAKAKRTEKRHERAQAKRQAEEQAEAAEQAVAAQRAVASAQKDAERTSREVTEKVVDVVERGTASAQDRARQVTEKVTETLTTRAQQVASGTREAMTIYGDAAHTMVEDMQAVRTSSATSRQAMADARSAWTEWFGKAMRTNVETSQQLMRSRSVKQVAEAQREFAASTMHNWMERRTTMLRIVQRTSEQALSPLDGRLNEAA